MLSKIVVVGAGFAGVWSALSAKRLLDLKKSRDIEITVVSPEPHLVLRPRLYEANVSSMTHPLGSLFESSGIKFVQGIAQSIRAEAHTVHVRSASGAQSTINYDRLILAAGSSIVRPKSVTGIQQYAFDIDSLDSAVKLEAHLEHLASLSASPARDTVVVCGAGFTGIELATELIKRLSHITNPRIILVDGSDELGSSLGPGPRPIITKAMKDLGIQVKLGSRVAEIDSEGLTLESGERIESKTVVWTGGVRATPLTQQIAGRKDDASRLYVDPYLQAPSAEHIFATGDAACALADSSGHYTLMSCQHALRLGRVSGHNAAADLLGEPMVEYSQEKYICCLDLGAWGTVVNGGWEREPKLTGYLAKQIKVYINQTIIYPPHNAQKAIAAAKPIPSESDATQKWMLQVIGACWRISSALVPW
jgi:NADH dehydrogenase FAD-containing subunit